jgi:hypothetical protein
MFSMGWCMREPYCPLSSTVCNATIPTFRRSVTFCIIFFKVYISFLSRVHDWTVAVAIVFQDMVWKLSKPQSGYNELCVYVEPYTLHRAHPLF